MQGVGFGCNLLGMTEITDEGRINAGQNGKGDDSLRIQGLNSSGSDNDDELAN